MANNLLLLLKEGHERYQRLHKQPPPQQQHIDVRGVHTLGDLVQLVQTWGPYYSDQVSYNLDLRALVAIREELEQLHGLVGLASFKQAVLTQLLYFLQRLHDADFMHTILCGPPGTGKTEIAQILGTLYAKLGILKNGTFKKVTRADLVGGFLGQTAIKTTKVIQECLGGCLFIDEAYSLASSSTNDSYSKECLDTLCEALSHHKGNLMVIIAGYEIDLQETIFQVNRGLESRFIWRFVLDPYCAKQLHAIFLKKVRDAGWSTDVDAAWFDDRRRFFPHFGRDMELLFTYTKCCHARRIFGKPEIHRKHAPLVDVDAGYAMFLQNRRQKSTCEIPGFYV